MSVSSLVFLMNAGLLLLALIPGFLLWAYLLALNLLLTFLAWPQSPLVTSMMPYSQMSPYQRRLFALVSASGVSWCTQSELAGLCPDMISKILSGKRSNSSLRVLLSLASHFHVSVDWLLGMDMRE